MQKYLYDMHVHTSEISACAWVDAVNVVRIYKENGYTGIVITDHLYNGFFESLEETSWEAKVDKYLVGYRTAKAEGERVGLKVILGAELRFPDSENDFLVYGMDEEFLYKNPYLYEGTLEDFRKKIDGKDILVYQAHPFRAGISRANPKLLDGVEVYNCNQRNEQHNDLSMEFAVSNNIKMISGGDFHREEDVGRGGIILEHAPEGTVELIKILKSNSNIELYHNI